MQPLDAADATILVALTRRITSIYTIQIESAGGPSSSPGKVKRQTVESEGVFKMRGDYPRLSCVKAGAFYSAFRLLQFTLYGLLGILFFAVHGRGETKLPSNGNRLPVILDFTQAATPGDQAATEFAAIESKFTPALFEACGYHSFFRESDPETQKHEITKMIARRWELFQHPDRFEQKRDGMIPDRIIPVPDMVVPEKSTFLLAAMNGLCVYRRSVTGIKLIHENHLEGDSGINRFIWWKPGQSGTIRILFTTDVRLHMASINLTTGELTRGDFFPIGQKVEIVSNRPLTFKVAVMAERPTLQQCDGSYAEKAKAMNPVVTAGELRAPCEPKPVVYSWSLREAGDSLEGIPDLVPVAWRTPIGSDPPFNAEDVTDAAIPQDPPAWLLSLSTWPPSNDYRLPAWLSTPALADCLWGLRMRRLLVRNGSIPDLYDDRLPAQFLSEYRVALPSVGSFAWMPSPYLTAGQLAGGLLTINKYGSCYFSREPATAKLVSLTEAGDAIPAWAFWEHGHGARWRYLVVYPDRWDKVASGELLLYRLDLRRNSFSLSEAITVDGDWVAEEDGRGHYFALKPAGVIQSTDSSNCSRMNCSGANDRSDAERKKCETECERIPRDGELRFIISHGKFVDSATGSVVPVD